MVTVQSIQAKIAKLQAQASAVATKQMSGALEKIRDLMQKHGVTIADIEAHSGSKRGRKSAAKASEGHSGVAPKYRDPKSGATWSGRGRAPLWIAAAKNRSKFLIAEVSEAPVANEKVAKAGNYPRGPQKPLYRDPKTGATWSGRGRAPAWLASVKDRTKFLISEAIDSVSTSASEKSSAAPTKKAAGKKVVTKSAAKKAVAKPTSAAKKSAQASAPAKKMVAEKAAAKKAPARKAAAKTVPAQKMAAVNGVPQPSEAADEQQ